MDYMDHLALLLVLAQDVGQVEEQCACWVIVTFTWNTKECPPSTPWHHLRRV